jgi:transcriptional regulator with XRE-family HTH domain
MSMGKKLRAARRAIAWNAMQRRRELRLTIEDAASKARISGRLWQHLEAGDANPTLTTLVRVACALDVEIPALFAPVGR